MTTVDIKARLNFYLRTTHVDGRSHLELIPSGAVISLWDLPSAARLRHGLLGAPPLNDIKISLPQFWVKGPPKLNSKRQYISLPVPALAEKMGQVVRNQKDLARQVASATNELEYTGLTITVSGAPASPHLNLRLYKHAL